MCLGLSVRPAEASIPHGHEELKMRTGSYHGRSRGSAGKRPADLLRASPRHPFPMRSRGPRRSPAPPLARAGQAARRDKRPTAPILSRPAPITSSVRPWRCGEARERHGCGHPDRTARAVSRPGCARRRRRRRRPERPRAGRPRRPHRRPRRNHAVAQPARPRNPPFHQPLNRNSPHRGSAQSWPARTKTLPGDPAIWPRRSRLAG